MEIIIAALGIILDRVTKLWAMKLLKGNEGIHVIKDYFDLMYLENTGAAWSLFQNKVPFLIIVTLLVLAGMIYYLIKYGPKSELFRISFALIIGGAIGNLYDRMSYRYVVDFISLHYQDKYYFPFFNIADMMVVFGTILLAIYILKDDK